jgi:two-component system cell cycle response regulator DivK
MSTNVILIVDDHPENLELALAMLSTEGYELRTAGDALEALEVLETLLPALILLDIELPGMDGLQLAQRLKADARTKHIPIIAVTAYAMKGDEQRTRAAGCDGYLSKPIDKRALRAMVAGYMRGEAPAVRATP